MSINKSYADTMAVSFSLLCINSILDEQLAKRLKVSLFMARLAKKKEKHLL